MDCLSVWSSERWAGFDGVNWTVSGEDSVANDQAWSPWLGTKVRT